MTRESISPLPVRVENVPQVLKDRSQWVAWKLESRTNKPTKVPYTPRTGRRASTSDLMTWGTFEEIISFLDKYDGIGFVFCTGDPYTGIDLDHCRDPETSKIEDWAMRIVQGLKSYAEVSPSGTGVHVIVKGTVPQNARRGKVEMYSSERFFTVTGHVLGGDGD